MYYKCITSDIGLSNYWGYNTLGFFAPDPRFSSSHDPISAVSEFKTMVRTLHSHGIEVILDVVYAAPVCVRVCFDVWCVQRTDAPVQVQSHGRGQPHGSAPLAQGHR